MSDGAGDRGKGGVAFDRRPAAARRLLTLAILLAVAAAKLGFEPDPVGHHSVDGSFYVQVARHVAAGEGLLTRASLYHQGLRELPHWSAIYPLWPLLLGGAGRVIGLERAAILLPPLLGLIAIALYGALTDRLARRLARGGEVVPGTRDAVTVGHLTMLLLGFNPVFFQHTSLPYSEGLGFALCFAALIALDVAAGRGGADGGPAVAPVEGGTRSGLHSWAALAGALAALAYLARSQLVGVVLAVPLALLVPAVRERRFLLASGLSLAAVLATLAPWLAFLARHPGGLTPAMLLDFTAFRETPELPPFALTVPASDWLDFVSDRASGILVAFNPWHPNSYVQSFGPSAFLPWIAGAALLLQPGELGRARAAVAAPAAIAVVGLLVAAAGSLAGVHLLHGTIIWPWWFHWRHGLPLSLPIALALAFVVARGTRWTRIVALSVVALSVAGGAASSLALRHDPRLVPHGPAPDEQALLDWVDASDPPPILITTHPQVLAAWTRRAGFHWIGCADDPAQLTALLRLLPIDGTIVYPGEERCPAFASLVQGERPADLRFGRIALWRNPGKRTP